MNVESNGMAAQALHQRLSILLSFKTRIVSSPLLGNAGRVDDFLNSVDLLCERLGSRPHQTCREKSVDEHRTVSRM
jgi:hypothetical protein